MTEVLCKATNGWQCEFYQMATECKGATDVGDGLVGTNCTAVEHYIPTFSVGGGSISERFSCCRAAGTKSLSPQGWSSASKWLRICI